MTLYFLKRRLKRLWNWLNLPPKCHIHGRSHLSNLYGRWGCEKCRCKECQAIGYHHRRCSQRRANL